MNTAARIIAQNRTDLVQYTTPDKQIAVTTFPAQQKKNLLQTASSFLKGFAHTFEPTRNFSNKNTSSLLEFFNEPPLLKTTRDSLPNPPKADDKITPVPL
ncbi:hypothetical protein CDAR_551141 [Caerostris darwini]|uniref:Uncharacterized protein n=1 Tax=Caerostris darwini TaxID=1538125 RepID=A0AAV4VMV1_9ARAC|nr:hypothetical protein CDAR_551141 [Caerostris darwini]